MSAALKSQPLCQPGHALLVSGAHGPRRGVAARGGPEPGLGGQAGVQALVLPFSSSSENESSNSDISLDC